MNGTPQVLVLLHWCTFSQSDILLSLFSACGLLRWAALGIQVIDIERYSCRFGVLTLCSILGLGHTFREILFNMLEHNNYYPG